MIDQARIDELKDEIGEDDFGEVVQIFLEEIEDALSGLDMGGSATRLAADLHALKGSAQNIGFAGFADICRRAEVEGAGADLKDRLQSALECSKQAISADIAD